MLWRRSEALDRRSLPRIGEAGLKSLAGLLDSPVCLAGVLGVGVGGLVGAGLRCFVYGTGGESYPLTTLTTILFFSLRRGVPLGEGDLWLTLFWLNERRSDTSIDCDRPSLLSRRG